MPVTCSLTLAGSSWTTAASMEGIPAGAISYGGRFLSRDKTALTSFARSLDAPVYVSEETKATDRPVAHIALDRLRIRKVIRMRRRSSSPPESWPHRIVNRLPRRVNGWLAELLARSRPLAPEPGWQFATGVDRSDRGTEFRRELWELYRERGIQRPVTIRWYDKLRVRLNLGNDMSLCLYVGGSFEPNEFVLLSKILRPGMVFVDGGANDGYYTLFAARRVGPEGHVLAIEPSSREFGRLQENTLLNRLTNVTAAQLALGEQEGAAELAVAETGHEGQNTLGDRISNPAVAAIRREEVRMTTLDALLASSALERVDVVKLDVEGSELAALRGAPETLRRHRPILQLEVETERLASQHATKNELLVLLAEAGYALFVFDPATAELRPPVTPGEPEGTLIAAPVGWVPPRLSVDA